MDTLENFFQGGNFPPNFFQDESHRLDSDEYINLLGQILTYLTDKNATPQMIDNVLIQWNLQDGDLDTTFITAAENFVCSNDVLRYVAQNATLSGPRYHMSQLMDKMSFGQIVNRILYAYQTSLDQDDLISLKEYVEMYESRTRRNADGVHYFLDRMLQTYADMPSWVSIHDGENKSYLTSVSLGCDLQQKNVFVEKLKKDSTNLTAIKNMDFLIEQFSRSISDIIDTDSSYDKSYRTWGPENRFIDRDCVANGPCRMLRCMCREAEEADGEKKSDWFTGKCDKCDKIIRDESHAIRFPHKSGGWKGCYCCFQCMRDLPPYQLDSDDSDRLIELQQQIVKVGIMDRAAF